jgi:hypothetical protein
VLEEIRTNTARPRKLGYGLTDLLVIAACSLTFAAIVGPVRHADPKGPPIAQIAQDLGTTPEAFRQATRGVMHRPPAGPPTDAQKELIAAALDVSVERLDTVMEKYRPDRLRPR